MLKKIFLASILWLFLMATSFFARASSDTLYVSSTSGDYIGKYVKWYEDKGKNFAIDDAVQKLSEGGFNKWHQDIINLGYTSNNFWFYITVTNADSVAQKLLWTFYRCGIAVTLYQLDDADNYTRLDSSNIFLPQSRRPYPSRALSFPVHLEANQTARLLAEVRLVNIDNMRIPMDIKPEVAWLHEETVFTGKIMSYLGLFLFVSLFNLVLWLMFRNPLYIWQFTHVVSIMMFNINEFFMEVYFIPEQVFLYWSYIPRPIWAIISAMAMLKVFMLFTQIKNHAPRWHLLMNGVFYLMLIYAIQHLLFNYLFTLQENFNYQTTFLQTSRMIGGRLILVAFTFLFITPLYLFNKVDFKARVYFISLFIMLLGAFFYITNFSGITNFTLFRPGNILIGLTFEIVVFTFIIVFSFFEERNEKIKLLSKQVALKSRIALETIEAQELERQRIAQELHDGLNGFLGALRFYVSGKILGFRKQQATHEVIDSLENIQNRLDESIKEVRQISHNLMPKDFSERGITEILEEHIALLNEGGVIEFVYDIDKKMNQLPVQLQITLFRIISELLNNIIKHSQASSSTITCKLVGNDIQLQVADNGKGFNTSEVHIGLGIQNIKSRLELINGNIEIKSAANETVFKIKIPLKHE